MAAASAPSHPSSGFGGSLDRLIKKRSPPAGASVPLASPTACGATAAAAPKEAPAASGVAAPAAAPATQAETARPPASPVLIRTADAPRSAEKHTGRRIDAIGEKLRGHAPEKELEKEPEKEPEHHASKDDAGPEEDDSAWAEAETEAWSNNRSREAMTHGSAHTGVEREPAFASQQAEVEEQARLQAEAKAKAEAGELARLETEDKARVEAAEAEAKAGAEEQARKEAEEKARLEAEEKARVAAEEKARLEAGAAEKARLEAEEKARLEAEEAARLEAGAKAKAATEEQARLEAAEKARLEAEPQREPALGAKDAEATSQPGPAPTPAPPTAVEEGGEGEIESDEGEAAKAGGAKNSVVLLNGAADSALAAAIAAASAAAAAVTPSSARAGGVTAEAAVAEMARGGPLAVGLNGADSDDDLPLHLLSSALSRKKAVSGADAAHDKAGTSVSALKTASPPDLLEMVARLQAAVAAQDEAAASSELDVLERVEVGYSLLRTTGADKALNMVAKAAQGQRSLGARTTALLQAWRDAALPSASKEPAEKAPKSKPAARKARQSKPAPERVAPSRAAAPKRSWLELQTDSDDSEDTAATKKVLKQRDAEERRLAKQAAAKLAADADNAAPVPPPSVATGTATAAAKPAARPKPASATARVASGARSKRKATQPASDRSDEEPPTSTARRADSEFEPLPLQLHTGGDPQLSKTNDWEGAKRFLRVISPPIPSVDWTKLTAQPGGGGGSANLRSEWD